MFLGISSYGPPKMAAPILKNTFCPISRNAQKGSVSESAPKINPFEEIKSERKVDQVNLVREKKNWNVSHKGSPRVVALYA